MATKATSRVKVSTEKLLEAVKSRRETMVANHAKSVTSHAKATEGYQGKVVEALRKALARAEAGNLPSHHSGYRASELHLPVRFDHPGKVNAKCDTSTIDRLIQTLEMASEPTIVITAEDAARFLG